jgi:catechol 2,3-dioxygenase-like lactoylglutathione lyase family enzyme
MRMMHINIGCSDFERSYEFYTQVVGMRPLTARVLQTGQPDPPEDGWRVRANGRRVAEHRMEGDHARTAAEVLGAEDGDGANRAVLLYLDEQPAGPFIDLQEWQQKTGAPSVTRGPKDLGLGRIALFVDDLGEQLDRLKAAGVDLVSEPGLLAVGTTDMRIVCFRDPDGTLLEFVELIEERAKMEWTNSARQAAGEVP